MPRPKVDPRFRRRVAQACENCKKRKSKCNGILPCDHCRARGVEDACRYLRYPRPASQESQLSRGLPNREARREPGPLDPASPASSSKQIDIPVSNLYSVSKDSQMLKDSRGKFIYVGDSASLSFLGSVRSTLRAAVGLCPFTNEPARNPMLEATSKIRFETVREPSIDLATAQSIAKEFFLAVSGILDFFDPPWLLAQLRDWVEQPSRRTNAKSAIIHLALAIGFQARAQGDLDELLSEQYFAFGRQLTMFNLIDDPSLATVQAVILITYHMMAACQYNAAFINLGTAARTAYTLGIHLHETNKAFGGEEGLARERAWKSLRVCDLFLAASLGRPPATTEAVSNIVWAPLKPPHDYERPDVAGQVFSAMFRICNVFERILVEVYAEKAISLELARSISQQHRQWTEELPRMLMVDGIDETGAEQNHGASPGGFCLSPKQGSSIVTMAYYYSIVLLTKPFLTFRVHHASDKEFSKSETSSIMISLATYADACVNSAIRSIDIAYEYVFELNTPSRQPLVVNSVFISALCLGLASLDKSGRYTWSVNPLLNRAIKILVHLGKLNPQASRFAGICEQLKEAVAIYTMRRDNTLLSENDKVARSIFGDLRASSKPRCYSESSVDHTDNTQLSWSVPANESVAKPITPRSFNFNTFQEESLLPISGLSPVQIGNLPMDYTQSNGNLGDVQYPHPTDNSIDALSEYFLNQNIPLFPLASSLSPESHFDFQDITLEPV
ncbi:hypothetical protein J3E68DRAFT_415843 [Trichoderma sp. SZMC 28012]